MIHFHANYEQSAFADSIWLDRDSTSALFHNLLHNGQAKPNTFTILLSCSGQLTEARKELWNVLSRDTNSRVTYVNNEAFKIGPIANLYFDATLVCKLDGILNDIYQYLLEASDISNDFR